MGPTDEAALIVVDLRYLAADFKQLAGMDGGESQSLRKKEEGGRLIMRASDLGFLPGIEDLSELVEWAKSPAPPLGDRQAQLVPCPSNLFTEFCGYNKVQARQTDDGWEIVSGDHGGIVPTAFPEIRRPCDPSKPMPWKAKGEHYAKVCDWLANRIEGYSKRASNGMTTTVRAIQTAPVAELDGFDRLGVAADLTLAVRAANHCLLNAHRLTHSILLGANVVTQQRALGRSRHPTEPQIEFPWSMCESGAATVVMLSQSCQQLRTALDPLGSIHVGVVQGQKRIGTMNGISFHDAVLNWAGSLVAEVVGGIWLAGAAPIISDQDKARIAEHWPTTAESVAKSETVITAQVEVNRILPLIVEEAVNAHRQRRNEISGPSILQASGSSYVSSHDSGDPDGVAARVLEQHETAIAIARNGPRDSRIKLGDTNVVLSDGKAFAVRPNGYKLFELLLEAPGEYVSLASHNLRTRDVESLPAKLHDAVESDPGAGTRIKREYLA